MEMSNSNDDSRLFAPIETTDRRFWIFTGTLLAIGLWGGFAWWTQLRRGLSVTGLNVPVFWGLYITNFVFFIGISHAGTLISAILRLAQAEWRRSITRAAEVITVLVLFFGMGCVILDLGRPDRVFNVLLHGNFTLTAAVGRHLRGLLPHGQHDLSLPPADSRHRHPSRPHAVAALALPPARAWLDAAPTSSATCSSAPSP